MPTIYHVCLEPIDQRYTKQWYDTIPNQISSMVHMLGKTNESWRVETVEGESIPDQTTPGAFLDFGATNVYKGSQVAKISKLFTEGKIQPGDKFLITDFWHFGITAIRYMSELLEIPVEIHSIAHAGAYDPSDILGMKMTKDWSAAQEQAWFYASDYMYFGSEFHKDMFLKNLKIKKSEHRKAIRSGQPHLAITNAISKFYGLPRKSNMIIFPHRLNSDKQPEIFKDLVEALPDDWCYMITQEEQLTKAEYYKALAASKIVFSCSLHENLGISQMEGVLCGSIPVVPNRASYKEMYDETFKYPSDWTSSWENYKQNKDKLVHFCTSLMKNYDQIHKNELAKQRQTLINDYLNANVMFENLLTKKD